MGRQYTNGSETWVELTDHDFIGEIESLVDGVRALKFAINNIKYEIESYNRKNVTKIFEEGTTNNIRYKEE